MEIIGSLPTPPPNRTSTAQHWMGSYRTNVYDNFVVQMDVIDWKTNLDELFGVFGRVLQPGLGNN